MYGWIISNFKLLLPVAMTTATGLNNNKACLKWEKSHSRSISTEINKKTVET